MGGLKGLILRFTPYWMQDVAVSAYNYRLYRQRHSGVYWKKRKYFADVNDAEEKKWRHDAHRRLESFLGYVTSASSWYASHAGKPLKDFPPLEKSDLINHLDSITTVGPGERLVSRTGGTTGASMKVYTTLADRQERFALLDHFRESFGYKLGEKVAWFSGKELATQRDVSRGRCYRDDLLNNIRFFSTFHINDSNFSSYWQALEKFKPRFMVGFPSSIFDLAAMANARGLVASYDVETVFPTAETVLGAHRDAVGSVFKAKMADQYASSEGAPFILECHHSRLHIHPLSGLFEVVNDRGEPASEGEVLVTSFTTRGTPLVRYRIGDRVKLAEPGDKCGCGSTFPLVDWIDGRTSDFLWSPENGRVNLGNLSNSTKDVDGILSFQVLQNEPNSIEVLVVGTHRFDATQRRLFMEALRVRTGSKMAINLRMVDSIPREKSGKFRIVKNSMSSTPPG